MSWTEDVRAGLARLDTSPRALRKAAFAVGGVLLLLAGGSSGEIVRPSCASGSLPQPRSSGSPGHWCPPGCARPTARG